MRLELAVSLGLLVGRGGREHAVAMWAAGGGQVLTGIFVF